MQRAHGACKKGIFAAELKTKASKSLLKRRLSDKFTRHPQPPRKPRQRPRQMRAADLHRLRRHGGDEIEDQVHFGL